MSALAPKVVGLFEEPSLGGPGFINLKLTLEYVNLQLQNILADTGRVAVGQCAPTGKTGAQQRDEWGVSRCLGRCCAVRALHVATRSTTPPAPAQWSKYHDKNRGSD